MAKKEGHSWYQLTDTGLSLKADPDGEGRLVRLPNQLVSSARGRLIDFDWAGAFCHVIAMTHKTGGLPSGRGAHATVKDWIVEWFKAKHGDKLCPSDRVIYLAVEKIYAAADSVK